MSEDAHVEAASPHPIVMVNGDKYSRIRLRARQRPSQLDAKLGKLETVIFQSTRPGSSRVSKVWHVPSLDYLPVRAEQIHQGKVETVMVLVALERARRSDSDS